MKVVTVKGTGGYWIVTKITINGNSYNALVDTGATNIIASEKVFANSKSKVHKLDVVGSIGNPSSKSRSFKGKLEIETSENYITRNNWIIPTTSFKHIYKMCDDAKLERVDVIIGMREIIKLDLSKMLFECLQKKITKN